MKGDTYSRGWKIKVKKKYNNGGNDFNVKEIRKETRRRTKYAEEKKKHGYKIGK